jgi:uncharacterized membrane protein YfcA
VSGGDRHSAVTGSSGPLDKTVAAQAFSATNIVEGTPLDLVSSLMPDGLSAVVGVALVGLSFLTSMLTAAFGIGGGIAMLSVMALLLPAPAIIPVHGVVQLGSNAGRCLILRAHVIRDALLPFALGSAVGAFAGGAVAVSLPAAAIQAGVGLFVLWSLYLPMPGFGRLAMPVGGLVSSALTMFFGATGPTRQAQVATHAALMTIQHTLKVVVFGLFGFAFAGYMPLVAAMIAAGFLGTMAGGRILMKLEDRTFQVAFTAILTVLALRLVWSGATGLMAGT